jgi:hypothetical protein
MAVGDGLGMDGGKTFCVRASAFGEGLPTEEHPPATNVIAMVKKTPKRACDNLLNTTSLDIELPLIKKEEKAQSRRMVS